MMDPTLADLLALARARGASDLHLSAGLAPTLRLNGRLEPVAGPGLDPAGLEAMLSAAMPADLRARYRETGDIDFSLEMEGLRYRGNAYRTLRGPAAAFRVVPDRVPTLADLGAPPILMDLSALPTGLILVTGPTGSGKSSTLAAMVGHILSRQNAHVITIEDPVEYVHAAPGGLVSQREIGRDTASFATALRAALREDPDIILVGELRDPETIQMALTAAETGHLVLGTLHTASAAKAVDRIIDVFPGPTKDMARAMLAGSLQAVIAQVLLPRADGRGRVAAHEVLVATPAVRSLIRENKIAQITSMIQMGSRFGMRTMADSLEALRRAGTIAAGNGAPGDPWTE
ncbi:MAG: hypothetical protein RLY86_202 [Pseudomonadota bacterium]|jgi:twitching motility protein PilT